MLETFQPLLDAVRDVDLTDPGAAEQALAARFDPAGEAALGLRERLVALLAAGELANRGELPVRWGRVAKATPETAGFSIDAVHMNGAGPRHRHPAGEVDYCIALDGEPRFDGRPAGWVVYGPESVHTPTVSAGTMLIVYFLPGGEIDFEPAG